jgi:hypothetical protein
LIIVPILGMRQILRCLLDFKIEEFLGARSRPGFCQRFVLNQNHRLRDRTTRKHKTLLQVLFLIKERLSLILMDFLKS